MTAAPSDALRWEVATFDALPDYPSSTPAGVNGDQSHFESPTYHIGIAELPVKGGYTNRTWEDQMPAAGSAWHSSATDESMSTADMVKNWNRHLAVYNDHSDPRRQYLAEYLGWNGVGSAERLDFQVNTRTSASVDHKWHRHRAKKRRYYNSMDAARACISIDRGETKEQYLASIGQPPMPQPQPNRRKKTMTEYLLFYRTGNPTSHDHGGGSPIWAVERPYHPNPTRRFELLPEAGMPGAVGNAGAGPNTQLSENAFKARQAKYAVGGEWSGPLDGSSDGS